MIFRWLRERRRARLRAEPFPDAWEAVLDRNIAYWRWLDDDERHRMRNLIRYFIAERSWEGTNGLPLTDEIRVTVAAQACLLILNLDPDSYRHVRTILIYPSGYFAPSRTRGAGGMVIESTSAVLGQAHYRGPVILSWAHVQRGGRHPHDGHNLVYHEFAHKLDMADGVVDGTPLLADRAQFDDWVKVMTREYEALINSHDPRRYWGEAWGDDGTGRAANRRPPTPAPLMRAYGATNPAEFFAVATEVFFEKPQEMRTRHADLYRVLSTYYKQDPAGRVARSMKDRSE